AHEAQEVNRATAEDDEDPPGVRWQGAATLQRHHGGGGGGSHAGDFSGWGEPGARAPPPRGGHGRGPRWAAARAGGGACLGCVGWWRRHGFPHTTWGRRAQRAQRARRAKNGGGWRRADGLDHSREPRLCRSVRWSA